MHFVDLRQNTNKSVCLYLVLILSDGIGVQFWKMIVCMFVWQPPNSFTHATMSKLINMVFELYLQILRRWCSYFAHKILELHVNLTGIGGSSEEC
jgi:hypothetical protein